MAKEQLIYALGFGIVVVFIGLIFEIVFGKSKK